MARLRPAGDGLLNGRLVVGVAHPPGITRETVEIGLDSDDLGELRRDPDRAGHQVQFANPGPCGAERQPQPFGAGLGLLAGLHHRGDVVAVDEVAYQLVPRIVNGAVFAAEPAPEPFGIDVLFLVIDEVLS